MIAAMNSRTIPSASRCTANGLRHWRKPALKCVLPAIVATLSLSACGGTPSPALTWQEINNKSVCSGTITNTCTGYYGFTVLPNGNYIVGPNVQGKTIGGALTGGEFAAINASASALASDVSSGAAAQCSEIMTMPSSSQNDIVSLSLSNLSTYLIQIGSPSCSQSANANAAAQLIAGMNQLTAKYYPAGF